MINDYLRQILTSKKLTASQKKNILGFLKFREARKILSEFLFQKRFLEVKFIIILSTNRYVCLIRVSPIYTNLLSTAYCNVTDVRIMNMKK